MLKIIFSLLLHIIVSWANQQPTVETVLGAINGYYKSSYEGRTFSAFEGIPYARPPTGDLRFEEPQPATPWKGILNATTLYTCTQIGFDTTSVFGEEDCLYLNVYVPKEGPSSSDNFDVLVHIHGGAFMMGHASTAGPSFFMDRNIIYVNFNYRIGLLGFLSTEDDVVPGNNGLKDQQLALKWVQSNIKRFGGNPNSVTLIGLSAGGASVHFHYFSEHSKGLFHRGISSSGTTLVPWAIQEAALDKTKKLSVLVNCHDRKIKNIINCLKKVPGNELVGKSSNFYGFSVVPIAPFAPVIEKYSKTAFLTEHPYQLLLRGKINDVPWMTSVTMDEGLTTTAIFERQLDEINENWNALLPILLDYNCTVAESQKTNVADRIKKYYFDDKELSSNSINNLTQLFSDRYFHMGFVTATQMQSKVSTSPIYAYIYNYETDFGAAKMFGSTLKGVSHGDDGFLMYDFDFKGMPVMDITLSSSDILMKNLLLDLVASFATNGKPRVMETKWEPMTVNRFNYLYIRNIAEIDMFENSELASKTFWESLPIMEYNQDLEIRNEL